MFGKDFEKGYYIATTIFFYTILYIHTHEAPQLIYNYTFNF